MVGLFSRNKTLGRRGEHDARAYLRRRRYRILERNLRSDHGELDIVALAPDRLTVVVVEVKARRYKDKSEAPPPEAAITEHKRAKLIDLTERLVNRRAWAGRPVRIDVVAISYDDKNRKHVRHFENAVTRG